MFEEEIASALGDLDKALVTFRGLGSSNPLSQRRNAESRYGMAYQLLVRYGARPQLKKKYRRGL